MDLTNFTPPARRSMTDDEIARELERIQAGSAGINDAMEFLEVQGQLRAAENMEFSTWVAEMQRNGSPQALLAVENARRAQQGLEPLRPPSPSPAPQIATPPVLPQIATPPVLPQIVTPQVVTPQVVTPQVVTPQVVTPLAPPPAVPFTTAPPVSSPIRNFPVPRYFEPSPVPPAEPPVEDIVSNLNNLYAHKPLETNISADLEDYVPEKEPAVEVLIVQPEISQESQRVKAADQFEQLLTGEIVIGVEEELTALEEEFADGLSPAAPVSAFDSSFVSEEQNLNPLFLQELDTEENPDSGAVAKVKSHSSASSQFWVWLGLGGTVLPLGLAWLVSKTGLAFSQAAVAIFLGALASGLVIAFGAIAGKRSGLSTLLLSRAPFGVFANAAPATVLTIVRLFWSAALLLSLFLIGKEAFRVPAVAENPFESTNLIFNIGLVVVVAVAVLIAIFGGRVLFRSQQISGLIGIAAFVTLVAVTIDDFSIQDLLQQPTGDWNLAFGIAVFSFSVFGLAWTSASADFALKLSTSARGAAVVGWSTLALVVIPTAVAVYGLALFGSGEQNLAYLPDSNFAIGTFSGDLIALMAPWLAVVLLGSAGVSAIVIMAMSLYSSTLSLNSLGIKLKPVIAQPMVGILIFGLAFAGTFYLEDPWKFLTDYALVAAVPVAAWSGIFIADVLIRRIAYHDISLGRSYGFYKSVNWVNLVGWLIVTAVGFGFTYIEQTGFGWTGFIADRLINQEFWATTSFGVIVTFAFAFLLPVIFGIPRIKRQETEVLEIESRRHDLKDVFGIID